MVAAKAAVDASALITLYSIEPSDEYLSLDSLDSLVVTSNLTVFLAQSLFYRSLAPGLRISINHRLPNKKLL